ncbi:NAD(P)-dependent oxidoreductase [Lysobacter sp. K5869]|uniref:NAD-dependent epimerase/dehydratase family protein n=1 Tax=Lysobacter sp. K5869 TaxID=2820808 RepID=UPI001C0610BC|nr:NAD(P)-dependent oxidoreductase [Lysobacter sp. K5869]QWP78371.1 NAD(P)-dependent oxidoreductase [Lysobacter sp. K5869]
MSLRIAVLGATGVYGRHLLPRLAAAGHRVRALVRDPANAAAAAACGAELAQADAFDPAALRAGLAGCELAINLATSLPRPDAPGDYAANDRLRRDGTPIWLRACAEAGVGRVLQQSIAMIHAGGGEAWADEDTEHPVVDAGIAADAIAAARDMEAAVRACGSDWAILRGGLFYGPGTGFDDDWFARARAGRLRLPGEGEDYVSLLHVADMAAATVAAIERWPSRRALIVADDRPVRWRDLLGHVCALAGAAPPAPGGRSLMPSFRVGNRRAREALAWAPAYPDYRAGLAR